MKDNVIELHPASDTLPCDTEPGEIAEAGMRVPTLRGDDRPFLAKLFAPFRRKPPTTYHKCLAVHMHFAKHTGALK